MMSKRLAVSGQRSAISLFDLADGCPLNAVRCRSFLCALCVSVAALIFCTGAAAEDDVIREFMCPCPDNCGKALENCLCGDADGYRDEVRAAQARGLSRDEVIAYFTGKYGMTALARPARRGFGTLAYAAPALFLLIGAAAAVLILRRWRRGPAQAEPPLSDDAKKKVEEMVRQWRQP